MKWIRTCQECLHEQESSPPPYTANERILNRWTEQKCHKCKSPALDWGSEEITAEPGDDFYEEPKNQ